jgi:hypothetical protein
LGFAVTGETDTKHLMSTADGSKAS